MGYLLDTVTISEFRRGPRADPAVIRWQRTLAGQPGFISVITLNELRYGLRKIEGKDPAFALLLSAWYENLVASQRRFPLLPIDRRIAEQAADLRAARNTPYNDSLIAATALVHDLTLATRNTADFQGSGVRLVDPWSAGNA